MLFQEKTVHGVKFELKNGQVYRDGELCEFERTSVRFGDGIGDFTHVMIARLPNGEAMGIWTYSPYDSRNRINAMQKEVGRMIAAHSVSAN